MKRLADKTNKRPAFTIVELLTVMSVIILLISLLVPSLNRMKRFSLYVKQRNHFKGIGEGLTMFNAEWEEYPDSGRLDNSGGAHGGLPYCGAMKLCEAMVGQDMLGFHPQSRFYQVGTINAAPPSPLPLSQGGNDLYPARRVPPPAQNVIEESERERRGLYISRENANAYKMGDLYNPGLVNSKFISNDSASLRVLCDVYGTAMHSQTGKTIGSPILYYKADTTKQGHDRNGSPNNIYDHLDNIDLIDIGIAMQPNFAHPMASVGTTPFDPPVPTDYRIFYDMILDEKITAVRKPYRDDGFILISAGFDGLYGTPDDVFNFEK